MDPLLIVALVAVLAAVLLGWWIGSRSAAAAHKERDAARAERDTLRSESEGWRGKFNEAVVNLAAEAEKVKRLNDVEAALAAERERSRALGEQVAAFQRGEAERERAHEAQLAQLKELEGKVEARFGELASKAVDGAHDRFLKQAEERFGHAGKQNEAKLKELLQPVQTSLERYEKGLTEIEKARNDSYGALKEAVAQLSQGNEVVRRETQRLANVMGASPKARGRWGEEQLRTILASAGLAENVDFTLQSSVNDGERQLRPDCVINLPGDRCIIVDVKCPLVAFEQAYDEEDEGRRAELLLQHAKAMGAYANDLGRKGYWRQFDLSPDFVIMFIPGEHFLSAAAERAPELIETAFRNGVIIASTINMLALAKIMAGMWQQDTVAKRANEVAEVGKELYRRLAAMGGHVSKLGRNLSLATGAYNDFVGSLESQVLTQAKRFESLKVETGGKAIEPVPVVELTTRPLTKLAELPTAAE
ncbi:MAG TPA: DNA recombination protein RmuC [Allosphingosinicella sp.]